MNERKKRLQDECSLLTTQCNNLINEHERLVKEITVRETLSRTPAQHLQHEKQRTTDLQQQIQAQTDSFEKEEKAEQERVSNLRREKEDRVCFLHTCVDDPPPDASSLPPTRGRGGQADAC